MAVMPEKAPVLQAELERLIALARPNDTEVDLGQRRTPGPLTDDELEEWVASLPRVGNRAVSLGPGGKASRVLRMTRRGQ